MTTELMIAGGAGLVVLCILLTPLSSRIGTPLLLVFLLIGMLVGEDGPGGVAFDDFELAYQIGSVALAVILFAGGLDTPVADIRKGSTPAIVLAIVGVILTAVLVAAFVHLVFGDDLVKSLLLGSVVGSTDAAATLLLLRGRGVRLKGRVGEIILVESGVNDPTAIFLTTVLVGLVDSGITELSWDVASTGLPIFALQVAGGLIGGFAGGFVLVTLVDRIALPDGLYPPLVLAGGLLLFEMTQLAGGSGYLAVFVAGVIIRQRMRRSMLRVVNFHEVCSWLSQIVMFLMLGLLVTPRDLMANLGAALLIAAMLMLVARPLAVTVCLTPLRVGWREQVYVGWVGLRGAVPIFLAIIPVISPGPIDDRFFNVVFVIVIASLILQGWTIPVTARWLRLSAD
jgi:NhaP-type Na+/H+ and K+/H+ antiporter